MDRKILAVGMIGLSLSLLVACGDKTNTQEPQQESDQSVIQQSDQQPMEVKQEAPANQDGASPEATTLGIVGAVDGSGETEESVPVDGIGEVETVGEVGTDELFTEVEETVYAISTVNIRASWSVDSDKLGSLTSGDSLTRIGIGIAGTEAEIWSKVVLSDGSIAYVGSSYLSTTKPVQQQQVTQQPVEQSQPEEQSTEVEEEKPAEPPAQQAPQNQAQTPPEAQEKLDDLIKNGNIWQDEDGVWHTNGKSEVYRLS